MSGILRLGFIFGVLGFGLLMGSIKISGIRALGTHEHFSGTLSSWVEGHGSWVWDSFMGLRFRTLRQGFPKRGCCFGVP